MPLSPESKTNLATSPFGIALSGGGYRATLFHLGALRRLNEIGWLPRLERIVSVSGGSLLLGYLLCRTPEVLDKSKGVSPLDWATKVSAPVHSFVKNDLRTKQTLLNFSVNWFTNRDKRLNNSINRLTKLYGQKTLGDVKRDNKDSVWPEIYILATDCVHGQAFKFSNSPNKSGHSLIGKATLDDFSIAKACMISACFPPIFGPYFPKFSSEIFKGKVHTQDEKDKIENLALVDGGLYDNLGVNLIIGGSDTFIRLFSDAGSPLGVTKKETKNSKIVIRYLKLMSGFIGRLNIQRVRSIQKNSYAFWSAQYHQDGAGKNAFGYDSDMVEDYLEHVRTDLDMFTDAEAKILENHGYAQVEFALRNEFELEYKKLNLPEPQWPYPEIEFTINEKIIPVLTKARKSKVFSQLFKLKLVDPI